MYRTVSGFHLRPLYALLVRLGTYFLVRFYNSEIFLYSMKFIPTRYLLRNTLFGWTPQLLLLPKYFVLIRICVLLTLYVIFVLYLLVVIKLVKLMGITEEQGTSYFTLDNVPIDPNYMEDQRMIPICKESRNLPWMWLWFPGE